MAPVVWRWQAGSSSVDHMLAAASGLSGSVYLAGYSEGSWSNSTANVGEKDFAAVSLDVDGALQWEWQDGTNVSDMFYGAASNEDGSVVLVGETDGDWAASSVGSGDFAAVMLTADGVEVWKWQDGSDAIDEMHAVVATADGSFVLGGYTFGDFDGLHQGASHDFAAVKLDADGNEIWRWQDGTSGDDVLTAAAAADDGSVVFAGSTEGNWNGTNAASIYNADFAAVKLDADGTEVWRWQGGSQSSDRLHAAAMGLDGSVILAGQTSGDWNGSNAGVTDFAALKLDADGVLQWRWQSGTTVQDYLYAASVLEDGSVLLTGDTEGSWATVSTGNKDFVAVVLDASGNELMRWQHGTGQDDEFDGIAAGSDGRVVLAGTTFGDWGTTRAGNGDFAAVMLNTSEIPTPSPTLGTAAPYPAPGGVPTPTPTPSQSGTPRPSVAPTADTTSPVTNSPATNSSATNSSDADVDTQTSSSERTTPARTGALSALAAAAAAAATALVVIVTADIMQ